ncbi:hypothetical protein HCH54_002148 [Aspergillus fumigatus]
MFGFEWHNQRGVEGTGFVRALRSRLTAHLPILMPELQRIVETAIADELVAPGSDGKWGSPQLCLIPSDCSRLRALQTVPYDQANGHQGQLLRLLRGGTWYDYPWHVRHRQAHCVAAQNPEFTAAALEFPQRVILAAEILRITPSFLRRSVANLVTRQHYAVRTLFRYLKPIVEKRLAARANSPRSLQEDAPMDCMQWLIDTSPRKIPWTPTRMVGEIVAVWFGSVHQLAMVRSYSARRNRLLGSKRKPVKLIV